MIYTNDEKNMIRAACDRYAGSFMQAIAGALVQADEANERKLYFYWGSEFQIYLNKGKEIAAKKPKMTTCSCFRQERYYIRNTHWSHYDENCELCHGTGLTEKREST